MKHNTSKAIEAFVDRMGQLASELGVNSSIGSIYALLYVSSRPLSLDEICESCGMSKGNASINVREMERWGAIHKVPVRGDRKSYYEANLDIVGIVRSRLREGLTRRFRDADRALTNIEDAIGSDASVEDEMLGVMRNRLAKVRETEIAVRSMVEALL